MPLERGLSGDDNDENSAVQTRDSQKALAGEEVQEIIQVVSTSIHWLLRLYNTIKSAGLGNQNKRAALFHIPENESKAREQLYRYWIARDFPGLRSNLVDRLVAVMLIRYRRVLYRRSRQEKLKLRQDDLPKRELTRPQAVSSSDVDGYASRQEIQAADSSLKPKDLASSEYTTTTVDAKQYRKAAAPSRVSKAVTISLSKMDRLSVPCPPKIEGAEEFVCPYCCLIRPFAEALDERIWV